MLRELLVSIRSFKRRPLVFLVVVSVMALCIGWLGAVFSLFETSFIRPLPLPDEDKVVRVFSGLPGKNVSYLNFLDYQKQSRTFKGMSAFIYDTGVGIQERDEVTLLDAAFVSKNFFAALQIPMHAGIPFGETPEESASRDDVVVLSHRLWRTHFGADSNIVGRSITLNNKVFSVVGITDPAFIGVSRRFATDLWIPVSNLTIAKPNYFLENRSHVGFSVIGRLNSESSVAQADAELEAIARRLELEYPSHAYNMTKTLSVVPEATAEIVLNEKQFHYYIVILSISAVLLVIACGNIGNLLLSNVIRRRGEIGIRLCLGASLRGLFRMLLAESIVLSLSGLLLGALLLVALLFVVLPAAGWNSITVSTNTLCLMAGVLALLIISFSTLPFLLVRQLDVASVVKESIAGSSGSMLKRLLLFGQLVLSTALLVAAFFFYGSLRNAEHVSPGFETKGISLIHLNLKPTRLSSDQAWSYFQGLKQHLAEQPGVESVGIGGGMPLSGHGWVEMYVDGLSSNEKGDNQFIVGQMRIGPDYFKTMGIPLLRGRYTEITDHFRTEHVQDHAGPLPIIVNEALADKFFQGEDAINKIVYKGTDRRALQIVGVIKDFKVDLWDNPEPCIYIPYDHNGPRGRFLVWHVKTASNAGLTYKRIAEIMEDYNRSVPIDIATSIERHLSSELGTLRIGGMVSACLAALGILLCAIGIWSMYRFELWGKRKEIGTRMAIGATDGILLAMVLKNCLLVALAGVAVGVAIAYYSLTRSAPLLYQMDIKSPFPYLFVIAIVLSVVVVSVWTAAGSMLRSNPSVLIREND